MAAKRKSTDYIPVTVPFTAASRAGEPVEKSTIEISQWANRVVWTDRMLNALTVGVRGGKWHALMDKVYSELNLFVVFRKGLYCPRYFPICTSTNWIIEWPAAAMNGGPSV